MKRFANAAALVLFVISLSVGAQSPAKKASIERLAQALASAYQAKALGRLDAAQPAAKTRVVIEHSLAEDDAKDRFVRQNFPSFAQAEQWLRKRETAEGAPFRESNPLLRCKQGVCAYDLARGLLHNRLYLQKIAYAYRRGRPYIKTIYLLDGD